MEKRNLRQIIRNRIATLSEEQRKLSSEQIFATVAALPDFADAKVVALYASLPDEPCSRRFIDEWSSRKRIVVPRVEGEIMHFYDYSPEVMQSGAFGIDEPCGARLCNPEEIDLMVVPGVAFTPDGRRMGRGKGFYDRYLSQDGFRAHTVGVCFEVQIIEDMPTEPHDRTLDKIISR